MVQLSITPVFPVYYENEETGYKNFIENLNRINIITFNYDISLECFLFSHLERGYFKNPELITQSKEALAKKIFHVYGQLREIQIVEDYGSLNKLLKKRNGHITYNQIASSEFEKIDRVLIKVIQEERDLQYLQTNISKIINNTDELYVLGFGFDKYNCQSVLGLHKKRATLLKVFCTNYKENEKLERKINYYFKSEKQAEKLLISNKCVSETMSSVFDFDNDDITLPPKKLMMYTTKKTNYEPLSMG